MCGIAAISRPEGRSSIPDLRHFARCATVAIERRGPDATGFGWFEDATPWYWKEEGRARFVAARAPLPLGIDTLIAHTRWSTIGDPSKNINNHPVTAPGLVLVHNGQVANADELNDAVGATPVGEVDSESLAWLMSSGPEALGADHPVDLLELVEGKASVAWLDSAEPGVLHLARLSGRPMHLGWTRRGDLVMSSTAETMADTSTLTEVAILDVMPVPTGTYLRVEHGRVTEQRSFEVRRPPADFAPDSASGGASSASSTIGGVDWDALVPRRGWVS